VTLFLQKIRSASPAVPVILTTAPDSYKQGRPNKVLRDINLALFDYCMKKNIPVWDLYRVTNGYGSALDWYRRGYMNEDGVHFTADGYRLQGLLFYNALAKSFNDFHGY
jgi:hypothetical protein